MFRAVGSSSRLIADGSTSPTGTGEFVAAAVTNSSPLPQTMLSATKSSAGSSTPSSNAAARSFRRCGLRAAATGGRFDGRAEAQPGAGNRRGREARAQSRRRSPASQPAVAGIRNSTLPKLSARPTTTVAVLPVCADPSVNRYTHRARGSAKIQDRAQARRSNRRRRSWNCAELQCERQLLLTRRLHRTDDVQLRAFIDPRVRCTNWSPSSANLSS